MKDEEVVINNLILVSTFLRYKGLALRSSSVRKSPLEKYSAKMEILHCLCIMMSEQVFPSGLHHVAPRNVEKGEVTSL